MEYKKSTYKKKTAAPKVQYKPKRGKLAPLMSEDSMVLNQAESNIKTVDIWSKLRFNSMK